MKNKFTTGLTHHFVDTTGNLAASVPIIAGLELLVGISEDISLKTRGVGIVTGYLGAQKLTRLIRDYSRKRKGITTKSKESKQHNHDRLNAAILTGISCFPSYWIAEQFSDQDISSLKMIYGTLARTGFAYVAGGISTYSEHAYRDLLCEDKHERISSEIYNASRSQRLSLVAALTITSIALTSGIYSLHH